jgi:hypothetical protein
MLRLVTASSSHLLSVEVVVEVDVVVGAVVEVEVVGVGVGKAVVEGLQYQS